MISDTEKKEIVKEKYGAIAAEINNQGCSCGCGKNSKIVGYTIMQDDYTSLDGYLPEADLGLGCGLPTEFADIKEGDTVVDLGSGAGNDVFVARAITGEKGTVYGIDFTPEMIAKAEKNNAKLGYSNVFFKYGEIEAIPLDPGIADVVLSNCVLNLVPDKIKAFEEIYRITKPGGHFCISDIVLKGDLPHQLKKSAEMYAGCVSGAVQEEEYIGIIESVGFKDVRIRKVKPIFLPDEVLREYLSNEKIEEFRQSKMGIVSITVTGEK